MAFPLPDHSEEKKCPLCGGKLPHPLESIDCPHNESQQADPVGEVKAAGINDGESFEEPGNLTGQDL